MPAPVTLQHTKAAALYVYVMQARDYPDLNDPDQVYFIYVCIKVGRLINYSYY
jgi:hypothetical protein